MSSGEQMELRTQYVDYGDGESIFEAYVAHDAALTQPRPCVLVAHDWSGQNQGIRTVAERVARLGWVAFALDVYGKGVRGDETGDNTALMAPMLGDRALLGRRLLAGLAAAKRHPAVDRRRIAAIGYCFGSACSTSRAPSRPTSSASSASTASSSRRTSDRSGRSPRRCCCSTDGRTRSRRRARCSRSRAS
jgi:dienelactone hydrolase